MISIGLKKTPADAQTNLDAVYVRPFPSIKDTKWVGIDRSRSQVVEASWLRWEVRLGRLDETQQDFVEDLLSSSQVQFIYNTITYNVEVDRVNIRNIGGSIILINRTAELS